MTTLMSLLVGSHFRPPAKTLLQALPAGARLSLRHDVDNPYDAAAVAVWLPSNEIPSSQHSFLEEKLPKQGFELAEVLAEPEWHLGYIAAKDGKPLRGTDYHSNQDFLKWCPCEGKLAFDDQGRACVIVQVEER